MYSFETSSFYYQTINEDPRFKDIDTIIASAKSKPSFRYGNVNRKEFGKKYIDHFWASRKVIALPLALWSGIVLPIYHFAQVLFKGIPEASSGNKNYAKAKLYYIARDFQEAFGRIASLFNDQYGLFHIQESVFHKSCYDCFINEPTPVKANKKPETEIEPEPKTEDKKNDKEVKNDKELVSENEKEKTPPKKGPEIPLPNVDRPIEPPEVPKSKYGVMVDPKAERISLYEYRNKPLNEREELCKELGTDIEKYINEHTILLKNLLSAEEEDLQKAIFLEDFIIPPHDSRLKFAIDYETALHQYKFSNYKDRVNEEKTKEDIRTANILRAAGQFAVVEEPINTNQARFIKLLLEKSKKHGENKSVVILEPSSSFQDAGNISAEKIQEHKTTIPPLAFAFFSNKQIKGLKLTDLDNMQCTNLFESLVESEIKERMRLFKDDDLFEAVYEKKVPCKILRFLTNAQKEKVKISRLPTGGMGQLFPDKDNRSEDIKLFAKYPVSEVQEALNRELFLSTQLELISDEQLKDIRLSKLKGGYFTDNLLIFLFPDKDKEKEKKRFAILDPQDLAEALKRLSTSSYILSLFSNNQIKAVRLSTLDRYVAMGLVRNMFPYGSGGDKEKAKQKERFANFDPDDVAEAVESGIAAGHPLSLLSHAQLKKVKLSKLSYGDINTWMFPESKDTKGDTIRMGLIDKTEVAAAKAKFGKYALSLIA